ncbi:E set domain-containing protein [Mycena sanguinolenta]|uniref:E set domain-containing protein n=1 Tax=Mycena sanguinolenta TaxID=230812 RepID=A0A8H6XDH4_9AGAR|nr:E set domain-containing protein [Mycena sanguinolenta]
MGAITTSSEDSKHSSSGPNRHRATTVSDSHNSAVGPQESMSLSRHGTLLSPSACATPLKRTVELKSLLGNANSRLPPGAFLSKQPYGQEPTAFEQAKPRARVEIDIMLQSNTCVEGGIFKGFIKLRIRPRMSKEPAVFISDGKLRIIGFETVAGDPHEFFQHATALSSIVTSPPRIYDSSPDSEGFHTAQEGVHRLDFEMQLPMGADRRPKGPFYGPSGVAVRYIALVSVKVKDEFNKRSIAHFYRDCQIWPRLNPSLILAPAEQPIQVTTSKSLFMGGNGEVQLTAALHRSTFVAGSTVIVNLSVKNDTKKTSQELHFDSVSVPGHLQAETLS